jgi:hypothetical protein
LSSRTQIEVKHIPKQTYSFTSIITDRDALATVKIVGAGKKESHRFIVEFDSATEARTINVFWARPEEG